MKWIKKHIKKFLIAIGILGVALAAGELLPSDPTDVSLMEVSIIQTKVGDRYAHMFIDKTTGKEFEIEVTKEQYDSLAKKNAGPAIYPNAKWKGSYWSPIYATSTPVLNDYQFVVISGEMATATTSSTAKIKIKMPDKAEKVIDGSFIINDKLTEEGLSTL